MACARASARGRSLSYLVSTATSATQIELRGEGFEEAVARHSEMAGTGAATALNGRPQLAPDELGDETRAATDETLVPCGVDHCQIDCRRAGGREAARVDTDTDATLGESRVWPHEHRLRPLHEAGRQMRCHHFRHRRSAPHRHGAEAAGVDH